MKNCIDFYDDSCEAWADNWYNNETLMPYLKKFLNHINKKTPRVLDLCCGAGYESMRLHNLGAQVVGTDLSKKSIELASKRNPNIEFYQKDMLKSYADLGTFDGITCIAGIVHLDENQLELAFKNMHEVMNPKGYLLLVFRDGDGVRETAEYNNVVYNRHFVFHKKQELDKYTSKYFDFVEEIKSIDDWRYYIYRKK